MDLVLQSAERLFPAGTTVTARLLSDFPVGWRAADGVPARASSQGSAAVQADGSLTITGLETGVRYRLSATVGSEVRFLSATAPLSGGDAEVLLVETSPSTVSTPNVYDVNDNLLTEVEELASGVTRTWTRTYDANGNMLTETYVDV